MRIRFRANQCDIHWIAILSSNIYLKASFCVQSSFSLPQRPAESGRKSYDIRQADHSNIFRNFFIDVCMKLGAIFYKLKYFMLPLLYVLLISYLFPVRTLGLREGAGEESVLTLRLVSDGGRALQTCSKLSDSMIEFQRKPRHKERQPPFNIA